MTERRSLLVALALLIALPAVAGAAPSRSAVEGTVAGVTSITWRGSAGFRLRVPRDLALPDDPVSTRIFLTGGTYAFVRFWSPKYCPAEFPHCATSMLTYTRELAESTFFGDPWRRRFGAGSDHFRSLGTPPTLIGGLNELYLMTDGTATVELRPRGVSGRVAYTAAGRIDAHVRRLPVHCEIAAQACDTAHGYADRMRMGGAAESVGASGYVESLTYNVSLPHEAAPGIYYQQPRSTRACVYPHPLNHASADPADHPTGCDVTGTTPDAVLDGAFGTYTETARAALNPQTMGFCTQMWDPDAKGKVYAGFQIPTVTNLPPPEYRTAYGIWFAYGIR
jgi:hypothetical protein